MGIMGCRPSGIKSGGRLDWTLTGRLAGLLIDQLATGVQLNSDGVIPRLMPWFPIVVGIEFARPEQVGVAEVADVHNESLPMI